MKNIVGQAVSGQNFFKRPKETRYLETLLTNGSHVLLSAPRRVGKTSLLYYLLEHPPLNSHCVYLITESIYSENDFYQRLCEVLKGASSAQGLFSRWSNKTADWLKSLGSQLKTVKIEGVGQVDLQEASDVSSDYYQQFLGYAQRVAQSSQKLIIMIDEFPQMVENILAEQGKEAAIQLLQRQREFRQTPLYREKLQLVYTGSIGLGNVVGQMGATQVINDLNEMNLGALSPKEAEQLVVELLEDTSYEVSETLRDALIAQIEWCIPFYLQVFIQEMGLYLDEQEREQLQEEDLEEIFNRLVEHRQYFDHWQSRLSKIFKKEEQRFVMGVLNHLCFHSSLSPYQALDLAMKHSIQEDYKQVFQVLVHDGYLRKDSEGAYAFNSALLKHWWRSYHAL